MITLKKFKNDKDGLKGRFKILGQVGLGIIVGATLYFHSQVTVKEELPITQQQEVVIDGTSVVKQFKPEEKSTKTTIPFLKNNEFDYADLITWINPDWKKYAWLIFIPLVIFIVTAVSNGANLTDGIDGLAAGTLSNYCLNTRDFCMGIR